MKKDILETIGNTPIVRINRMNPNKNATIYAKLEGFNPTGSVKDRIALSMIQQAETEGKLSKGKTIIEPTSGNTGVALAMIGQVKGYEVEVYCQDIDEVHRSSGVYSILYDEWVVEPKRTSPKFDVDKVLEKSVGWMSMIDELQQQSYQKSPKEILDSIEKLKLKLKKYRNAGLERGGEFSYENLVFKFLRRSGYIKQLFDLKNKLFDLSLSLD